MRGANNVRRDNRLLDADFRNDLVAAANERDTSAEKLVEATIRRYYDSARGNVMERAVNRLERVTTTGDEFDTTECAIEWQRDIIAATVASDDRIGSKLVDFDGIIDERVHQPLFNSYARNKHLDPAIERIDSPSTLTTRISSSSARGLLYRPTAQIATQAVDCQC